MIPTKPFLLSAAVLLGTAGTAAARPAAPPAFKLKVFAGAPHHGVSGPDDIAYLNGHVFVAWQNGVGTKGEAAPSTHKTQSLLVEYRKNGHVAASWNLAGKIDGIGADPNLKAIVATANEDGKSHLFTVKPGAPKARDLPRGLARAHRPPVPHVLRSCSGD